MAGPPEEVAFFNRPPLLEDSSIRGPLRVPVEGAMNTLEERDAIEADFTWYRYSKFAAPCLLVILILASLLAGLTAWQQVGGIKNFDSQTNPDHEEPNNTFATRSRVGVPHLVVLEGESEADSEGGLSKGLRNVRAATVFAGFLSIALILLVFLCKPRPFPRSVLYVCLSILLIVAAVLAWISFGWGIDTLNNARQCPDNRAATYEKCLSRKGVATVAVVMSAAVGTGCLACTYLLLMYTFQGDFKLLRTGWREQERDNQHEVKAQRTPEHAAKLYIRDVRVTLLLIALVLTLLCVIVLAIVTVILHEDRDVSERRTANGVNLLTRSGWPERNTRLRYALSALTILTVLLNCIPFIHRIIAYFFALCYFVAAILCFVTFFFDVHELGEADNIGCPAGYKCVKSPFIGTAFLEFILGCVLMFYVLYEICCKCCFTSKHSKREYAPHEIKKHDECLDSLRPVRDEGSGDLVTAKDYVYVRRQQAGLPAAATVQQVAPTYTMPPAASYVAQPTFVPSAVPMGTATPTYIAAPQPVVV